MRSDTSEMASCIASARPWASRNWYTMGFACAANVLVLLIFLAVSLSTSVRAAAWASVPIFLAWNGYVLWRAQASHRRWVAVVSANRFYVRLFARHAEGHGDACEPDILVLEAPEIASMSVRTVNVFLYGPKPKAVEWLVIEPAQSIAHAVSSHIRPTLTQTDPDKAVLVAPDNGLLTIEWKWWRPALRVFIQQVARECPSIVVGPEQRSELDLNGIWRGISLNLDPQKRQLLIRAIRLGFGCECKRLLSRYRYVSLQKAAAYIAQIEREETGEESPCSSA